MGSTCSNLDKDGTSSEKNAPAETTQDSRPPSSQPNMLSHQQPSSLPLEHLNDITTSRTMIDAQHEVIEHRLISTGTSSSILKRTPVDEAGASSGSPKFSSLDDYQRERDILRARERALAFDFRLTQTASKKERHANRIIQKLRARDNCEIYGKAEWRTGHHGQMHPRFPGDHFLSNVDLIEETDLYRVAKMMPKGAHLHIHFNCCLPPDFLLNIAKEQPRMFIRSDMPLLLGEPLAFERCEIQFSLIAEGDEKSGNIFKPTYQHGQDMLFSEFLAHFPFKEKGDPALWLQRKLMFASEEAHHVQQTSPGAWAKFNGRTRMMKGLFNYEEAFRQYTRAVLQDFVDDNIQYAEIRPNFMDSNMLKLEDHTSKAGNHRTVEIIIEEYHAFQKRGLTTSLRRAYFAGLKIIYCTPRSFSNNLIADALAECLDFKKEWPQWIAGFDLVGEEGNGRPLRDFIPELLQFRKDCEEAKLDIPFLFHCGETLEIGSDTDGNVLDALLLNSKRIGHGFALARHPYIMERMKEKNICLEVCPISNEILGLTPRVNGHSMYNLLANNVHCTVSSDNGTIFRSTLSHDFYQVMIGKADMTLHGWRQLIEWSFQHACMEDTLRREAETQWLLLWDEFLDAVIEKYEDVLSWVPELPTPQQHSEREWEKEWYSPS